MDRDLLLALRLPCEHGEQRPHYPHRPGTDKPMITDEGLPYECPGGVAVATECPKCDGGHILKQREKHPRPGVTQSTDYWEPCPDCTDGLQLTDQGQQIADMLMRMVGGKQQCVALVTEDYGYQHPCGEGEHEEAHHPDYGHRYEPGWVVRRLLGPELETR